MKNIDSIIFDLDGTLWDSTEGVQKAWFVALKNLEYIENEITSEDIKSVFGMRHDLIGGKLFPYLSVDLRDQTMEKCYEEENSYLAQNGGNLYEGLEETIKSLSKDYKLFIVSNCQKGYIEAFFQAHRLGKYFKDIECSGNTGLSKDRNIRSIIERNELKNPIYIGDTLGDCEATRKNRIPFIFAAYGFGDVDDFDFKIEKFSDILSLLKKNN